MNGVELAPRSRPCQLGSRRPRTQSCGCGPSPLELPPTIRQWAEDSATRQVKAIREQIYRSAACRVRPVVTPVGRGSLRDHTVDLASRCPLSTSPQDAGRRLREFQVTTWVRGGCPRPHPAPRGDVGRKTKTPSPLSGCRRGGRRRRSASLEAVGQHFELAPSVHDEACALGLAHRADGPRGVDGQPTAAGACRRVEGVVVPPRRPGQRAPCVPGACAAATRASATPGVQSAVVSAPPPCVRSWMAATGSRVVRVDDIVRSSPGRAFQRLLEIPRR
jgi:hypothetical protein